MQKFLIMKINNKTKIQIMKFFSKLKVVSISEKKKIKNKILGCKL